MRDRLRSGVADQGHRDDDARDARRRRRPARTWTTRWAKWLRDWRGDDRDDVTIRDLLAHASGLTAYLPFYRDYTGRFEFEHAICSLPLEYAPRSQSLYSDLGFMLLGFILEDAQPSGPAFSGAPGAIDPSRSLATQFHRLASFFTPEPLRFSPPRAWRTRTAPTEIDEWRGRLLVGEVHDENTWALGGAAGHAGLFGTAAAVGAFARAVLRTIAGEPILARPETMRAFIAADGCPGQLTRARMGHDAPDVVVRHEALADVDRSHRLHGDVALDRLGARSLRRAPDQPRAPDADQRGDQKSAAARCTTRSSPSWTPRWRWLRPQGSRLIEL